MKELQGRSAIICTAGDAAYFPLLRGLVESLKEGPFTRNLNIGVLDLGLTIDQCDWLAAQGARLVEPGWDIDFPHRDECPGYFRAMVARPSLPRYFPHHDVIVWIDADAWVQDDSILPHFMRAALRGKLAIVPELDRNYWTSFIAPKLWGANQKAFAWSFGTLAGYRLGRNPILNSGVFALTTEAPHWRMWSDALTRSLNRRRTGGGNFLKDFHFVLAEQTALNYVVFGQSQPYTLLPAVANWFCGKGTPAWDADRGMVVEPNEPHQPLSIIHLAGKNMKERVWELQTIQGGNVSTRLTREEIKALRERSIA